MDFENRSLKSQMRRADKFGTSYVVIVGDRELDEGVAIFRNMATKEQEKVVLQEVVGTAVERIRAFTVDSEL
jgi:histidyl-tRNA synthetase